MDAAISSSVSSANVKLVPVHENLPSAKTRVSSIDIVRGVVMLLMAIDHVRVYSGLPAGGSTPGIFFTRWVTHFVAPAFCFLAGAGAWLHGRKLNTKKTLAWFLLTRGAWLIFLELTVLRIAWTFNLDFQHYMLAGVIWMLGWCMVLLAGLIWLPVPVIAFFGLTIIAAHNILDFYVPQIRPALQSSSVAWLAQFLYFGGTVEIGSAHIPLAVLYSIIPWIGVMAAGYAYGSLMDLPAEKRRRLNLAIGCGCIALFLILRSLDVYGDPRSWNPKPRPQQAATQFKQPAATQSSGTGGSAGAASGNTSGASQATPAPARPAPVHPPAYIRFLNTAKYPASLLFLLMTLGPMFVGLALSENWRGKFADVLEVFGRVPMWYYLLHIPLIHVLALLVSLV
ncbi:MAG TPA: heparan-alpha-glucosaminide N-acetyltransferase domain-containing protein, partial [Candidatus Sulfotelmatobacter sp.]|nr:heparan-alpha-glucosaminide N-acetyltransferase domain-containing protein [Candidatus Sulfotelmatobacter sp.]